MLKMILDSMPMLLALLTQVESYVTHQIHNFDGSPEIYSFLIKAIGLHMLYLF